MSDWHEEDCQCIECREEREDEIRGRDLCADCCHARAYHIPPQPLFGGCSLGEESVIRCSCRAFREPAACEHCGRPLNGRVHWPQGGYCVLAPKEGESAT